MGRTPTHPYTKKFTAQKMENMGLNGKLRPMSIDNSGGREARCKSNALHFLTKMSKLTSKLKKSKLKKTWGKETQQSCCWCLLWKTLVSKNLSYQMQKCKSQKMPSKSGKYIFLHFNLRYNSLNWKVKVTFSLKIVMISLKNS